MTGRKQNPAGRFIAQHLATALGPAGVEWADLTTDERMKWIRHSDDLVIAMYHAGFRIPMPEEVENA